MMSHARDVLRCMRTVTCVIRRISSIECNNFAVSYSITYVVLMCCIWKK